MRELGFLRILTRRIGSREIRRGRILDREKVEHVPGHTPAFGQWVQDQDPAVLQSIQDSKQN